MVEDEFLQEFLAKAVEDVKQQIKETGTLTVENAIPLLLHSQYNHILHLEEKMATKADIAALQDKIATLEKNVFDKIATLQHGIMYGLTLLAVFLSLVMWLLR